MAFHSTGVLQFAELLELLSTYAGSEAGREMIRYGFQDLAMHRIFASHFKHNPASGRILQKLGMQHEGCQREHLLKWGQFVDSELYGLLRGEWAARE